MSSKLLNNADIISCINKDDSEKLKNLFTKYLKQKDSSSTHAISQKHLDNYLLQAAKKKSTKCLEVCLQNGANANTRDKDGMSAMLYSAERQNLEALLTLTTFGGDANIYDNDGTTALMFACKWGYPDCLQLLINLSSNINQSDKNGCTALKFAAQYNSLDCVRRLIDAGANKNCTDYKDGYTPLMHALKRDNKDIACLLIDRKADVNIVGKDGKTALTLAFQQKNLELIEFILKQGADIGLCIENHLYLHEMIACGYTNLVRLMVINGCLPKDHICKDNCFKFNFTQEEPLSPICVALLSLQSVTARYLVVNKFFSTNDRTKLVENLSKIRVALEEQQLQATDTLSVLDYVCSHFDALLLNLNDSSEHMPHWPYSKLCIVEWSKIPLDDPMDTKPCNCLECVDGLKII